ncbi:MAG: SH3 domain-containing protein [Anaerolineae bacterium]|nr:SH3 domain-containing protein [Anaerolineae bacterium]
MQAVLSVIISLLGAIGILAAIFFGLRALSSRLQMSKQAYGVGQLESRRSMQKDLIWAGMALIVGLIFLGVYALLPDGSEAAAPAPEQTPVPETTVESIETEQTDAATDTAQNTPEATNSPTPVPFPEAQVTVLPTNPPAPSPTSVPTATPEPELQTAVVASGVGVYLRQNPSTTAPDIEWLLDGTQLVVLPDRQDADGYTWVLVRTAEGNEGWVATDFIEIAP